MLWATTLADGTQVCFGANDAGQCDVPAGVGPVTAVAALCCGLQLATICMNIRSKHNAALLHNPNQGVTTTVQEDNKYTRTEITRRKTGLIR